jgi:hypothetical protein
MTADQSDGHGSADDGVSAASAADEADGGPEKVAPETESSPSTVSPEETEHMLTQLFGALGISRIICVDDVFAAGEDEFIAQLAELSPEHRADVFSADAEEYRPDGVWQQRARNVWGDLSESEQASLVDRAYALAGGDEPVERGAVHALERVLPDAFKLDGLSLGEWRADKDSVLEVAEKELTLILVDQDFSHEQAAADEGQRIIEELEQVLGPNPNSNVYYGLLTNKVKPGEEHEKRREILDQTELDPQRLVIMSKLDLDSEELYRFAARLRSTLLAPSLAGLISAVADALAAEQEEAKQRIDEIGPEELEHILITASDREGEWPADVVVRVLGAMQRAKVREKLRTAPSVEQLTSRLQAVAAVTGPLETESSPPKAPAATGTPAAGHTHETAATIMHEEVYDEAEHVNNLFLPIELGDIVKCVSGGQLWVVVAQPCDLMVRPGGKRAPELTHTTVAKIRKATEGEKPLFSEFALPYFDAGGEEFAVQLGRVAYPRAVILDACVLNPDGRARLDLKAVAAGRLLPHWRTRHEELLKVGKMLLDRTDQATDGVLGLDAIVGHYRGDPFKPVRVDRENQLIEWDCRRIGRVGEPYARALLTRFTQYQARDAFVSDLAR